MEVCVRRRGMYVGEGCMSEGGVCEGGGACVREEGHV